MATIASAASVASFADLLAKIAYLDAASIETVRQAYRWADELHLGQFRHSGEPYITHPLAVTQLCADWKLDAQALCAALLHDALEDCGITKDEIVLRFGSTVADLVDGLTKLEKLPVLTREQNQAESFRKMLLAMATDVRVILIKLADRTHNMRTLGDSPASKWGRIAGETQDIYAPIAHRLGLNQTYRELQDLSFKYTKPWRYQTLTQATAKARARAKDLINTGELALNQAFERSQLKVSISGREKTLFSIYRKMRTKHVNFADINDLFGFRVVVDNLTDCYTALGVLHQLYKPVPGRFKDHIAIPKANGYQSLHTTLVGPSNVSVEFQIRTEPMHWVAETGVAADWLYKSNDSSNNPNGLTKDNVGAQWLQSLLDIQNETVDASEFWDHVRVDLFPDAVYVFTPKNRIMALPRGATVVDFAYAVHSTIGDRCMAAKINGELAPLRTELKNGDRIEIVTAAVSQPNPAWLGFVRTGRARSKIRHHLKSQAQSQSLQLGEKLLLSALKSEGYGSLPDTGLQASIWEKLRHFTGNQSQADLLADLGLGKRMAKVVAKRLARLLSESGSAPDAFLLSNQLLLGQGAAVQQLVVDGTASSHIVMATCCHPLPNDAIVGYLGHGEGLVIHRSICTQAAKLQNKDPDRMMPAVWSDEIERSFEVPITVSVQDAQGVLAQVTSALAAADANIVFIGMGSEAAQSTTDLKFRIMVRDTAHIAQVLASLARVASVLKATRS